MKQSRANSISIPTLLLSGCIAIFGCSRGANPDDIPMDVIIDNNYDYESGLDTVEVPQQCIPSPEICNGKDDDCDGTVDNGFDLQNDPENCGSCGWVCSLENATAKCEEGSCWVDTCNDGFHDINKSPTDGCEYECTPSSVIESQEDGTCSDSIDNDCDGRADSDDPDCSSCVPEFCDYIDNDCDGLVDEDFNLRTDRQNCGNCGVVCPDYPRAEGICIAGVCDIVCEPGWSNLDGNILNGCESICTPSDNPNESVCNGIDDDCDGFIDEDYLPYPCGTGACATLSICHEGVESCTPRDPLTDEDTICNNIDDDCDNLVDEDFVPTDKCVGACKTNARCIDGEEICGEPMENDTTCDNIDDDCDTLIDDDYIPYTCGTGACTRESTCTSGIERCDEGPPSPEICNGSDDDCNGFIDDADISSLCPITPPHATPACVDGVCVVGSCDSGYYDLNGNYADGCECEVESTESASTTCENAYNLGNIPDDGTKITISGNIVPEGDSDWYKFNAVDSPDTTCDSFSVDVRFAVNPSGVFRFAVYKGSCDGPVFCNNENEYAQWYTDFRSGTGSSARGECQCRATNEPGYNICNDDTSTFYVRVYRAAGSTLNCDNYTIEISNGLYLHH